MIQCITDKNLLDVIIIHKNHQIRFIGKEALTRTDMNKIFINTINKIKIMVNSIEPFVLKMSKLMNL